MRIISLILDYVEFENLKEWWFKAVSMLGSFTSLYFTLIWWNETKEKEPIITAIGLTITTIYQFITWRSFNKYDFPLSSRHDLQKDDAVHDRILNLSAYDYEIIVQPISTQYWRWGLKFSNEFNFTIPGRVVPGHPLFHLTDSNNGTLAVTYYNDQGKIWTGGVQEILNHYDGEPITVIISSGINHINISVVKDGQTKFTFNSESKYFFAQIMTWADNQKYEIKTTVKEKRQKK